MTGSDTEGRKGKSCDKYALRISYSAVKESPALNRAELFPKGFTNLVPSSVLCRERTASSNFILFMISTAGPRMSADWPVTLGEGDLSMIVVDTLRGVWASQYARQDPTMPAPETRTLNSGADIVLCRMLKTEV